VGKIEYFQFLQFFQILYIFNHIVLQEEVFQLQERLQVFYLGDNVVLKVERFKVYVLLQATNVLNYFVVKIQLLIHLGIFIKTISLANDLEVAFIHNQATSFSSLQVSISARNIQFFMIGQR